MLDIVDNFLIDPVAFSARKEWNVTTGKSGATKVEYSLGVAKVKGLDASVKDDGNIGIGISAKVALGLGIKANAGINLNLDKFKNAIKPLGTKFTPYEQKMQDAKDQGTKTFNPDDY